MASATKTRAAKAAVLSGIMGILDGTTTADEVLADVAVVEVLESTPARKSRARKALTGAELAEVVGDEKAIAAFAEVEAAPVVDADGEPSDATIEMLAVDPAAKKAEKAARRAAKAKVAPATDEQPEVFLITLRERDAIRAAGTETALIEALKADVDVRVSNGKTRPDSIPAIFPQYYRNWRTQVIVPASLIEGHNAVKPESMGWKDAPTLTVVEEGAVDAPALPAVEKVTRYRKAKAVVEATDSLPSDAYAEAIGTDEVQTALRIVADAHLGREHSVSDD